MSKMKKFGKKGKNFSKGYLQNAFCVVNYGKNIKSGRVVKLLDKVNLSQK